MKFGGAPLKDMPGATGTVNGGLLLAMPWDVLGKRVSLPIFQFSCFVFCLLIFSPPGSQHS